jgi:hypothetical protein
MQMLLAFDEEYRVYRDVIAGALRALRPRAKVSTSTLEELGARIEAFDPDLVISTRSNSVDPGGRHAWVELSVDPLRPTKICVGGCRSERTNPSVEMLLTVVDEVERVVAEGDDPRGC